MVVRAGGPVSVLDPATGVAAALVLVYLVWALLRPEDL
jgi:hypothetical protein